MATSRTAKVQAEIEKAKAKLTEQQAKIRELEGKKTNIENTEIVDIVRGLSIPLDELAALLQSIRGGAAPAPVTSSGRNVPKPKESIPETENTEKGDESE